MRGDVLKGHLEGLILAVLRAGPSHGYAVIEALKARSGGALDLPEGTVYPILHRLEEAGLLTSHWSEGGGRKRRVYSLSRGGRRRLEDYRSEWRALTDAISAILEGGPWHAPT